MSRSFPALIVLLVLGCDPDKTTPVGVGDDTAAAAVLPDCPASWWSEWDEGIQLQSAGCLAWSPRAGDAMDWFAAVGPEDAVAGGCGSYCSDEPGYCDELELAGITSWRLPSKAELEAAGSGEPPLEPLDEALWSRDSLPAVEDMAYQVVLDTPELDFMQGKDQDGWVRCVADL